MSEYYKEALAVTIWQNNVDITSGITIRSPYNDISYHHLVENLQACEEHNPYEIKAVPTTKQTTTEPGYGTVVKNFIVPKEGESSGDFDKRITLNFKEGEEEVDLNISKFTGLDGNGDEETATMLDSEISLVKVGGIIATEHGEGDNGEYQAAWVPTGSTRIVIIPDDLTDYAITRIDKNISLDGGAHNVTVYPPLNLLIRFLDRNGEPISNDDISAKYYVREEAGHDAFWRRIHTAKNSAGTDIAADFHTTRLLIGSGQLRVVWEHTSGETGTITKTLDYVRDGKDTEVGNGTFADFTWYIDTTVGESVSTFKLTISSNPSGAGSVVIRQSDGSYSSNDTYFEAGQRVEVRAVANRDYSIRDWVLNGSQIAAASYSTTFRMPSRDSSIVARFLGSMDIVS